MDYSFRQFIEQNYMDQLIAAADSFIQSDNRCDIEVTVKYALIEDIDYSPLKRGGDFFRFPVVLYASTLAIENGESYRREVFLRGMLSGSFSRRFEDIDVHCHAASTLRYKRFNRTYTDELLPITRKEDIEKDAEAFLNTVRLFADCPAGRIDTIAFAKELGIRVYFAPISDDHSVRAEFFFFNTESIVTFLLSLTLFK